MIIVKYKSEKSFTTNTEANYWHLISAANGPTNTDYVNSSLISNIKVIVFSMVFHYLPRYHNEVSRQASLCSPHTLEMAFDCRVHSPHGAEEEKEHSTLW